MKVDLQPWFCSIASLMQDTCMFTLSDFCWTSLPVQLRITQEWYNIRAAPTIHDDDHIVLTGSRWLWQAVPFSVLSLYCYSCIVNLLLFVPRHVPAPREDEEECFRLLLPLRREQQLKHLRSGVLLWFCFFAVLKDGLFLYSDQGP